MRYLPPPPVPGLAGTPTTEPLASEVYTPAGPCCRWCGKPIAPARVRPNGTSRMRFCSDGCKAHMHNTRRLRAETVYDLLMHRAAQTTSKNRGRTLTELDRLARQYVKEDRSAGRKSWVTPE